MEVGNVTPENKAHLFITELLPKISVHSNTRKQLSRLGLSHKISLRITLRILIPVDVIKTTENNNNS